MSQMVLMMNQMMNQTQINHQTQVNSQMMRKNQPTEVTPAKVPIIDEMYG